MYYSMSRDYKTAPPSPTLGKNRSTLVLGLFVGYALGLLTAIGTWMYINNAPSPFVSQDKLADNRVSDQAVNEAGKGGPASPPESDAAKAADMKPRFEFYSLLPETEEVVREQQAIKDSKASAAPTAALPAAKDKYFLQAGSFQKAGDAENLKARLAMAGVEATVQSTELPEKGVWHRVRVGPFATADEMNRARASLQQNGIQSSPIKVHEKR
jgi:cell division protein FtsN